MKSLAAGAKSASQFAVILIFAAPFFSGCDVQSSAVVGLWATFGAVYVLYFLFAVKVSAGIWRSQRLNLASLLTSKPGTRTSFLIALLCACGVVTAIIKVASSSMPLLGVDISATLPFALWSSFIFLNSQNSAHVWFGCRAVRSKRRRRSKTAKACAGCVQCVVAKHHLAFVCGVACDRGSSMLWGKVHMCMNAVSVLIVGWIAVWFCNSLRGVIQDNLATSLGNIKSKHSDSLRVLDSHLARYARAGLPGMIINTTLYLVFALVPPLFRYLSYIIPAWGLFGATTFFVQLRRAEMLITIESDNEQLLSTDGTAGNGVASRVKPARDVHASRVVVTKAKSPKSQAAQLPQTKANGAASDGVAARSDGAVVIV